MEHKYTGIILGKRDIGEADRIYSIYTLEAGKIRVKAVGVRKQGAKLAGSLETFFLTNLLLVKRNGAGKIKSAIVEKSFPRLRADFDSVFLLTEMTHFFDQLTGLGEKEERLFYLLSDYLTVMDRAAGQIARLEVLSVGFLFQLLKLSGYAINTTSCAVCEKTISQVKNFFSLKREGIICGNCSVKDGNNFFLSANGVKLLRLASRYKIETLSKIKMKREEAKKTRKIIEAFCREIIS